MYVALAQMALFIGTVFAASLLLAEAGTPVSHDRQPPSASSQMHEIAQTTSHGVVPALRAQVVSARTGLPIAGASVFGFWLSDQFSDTLHIAETKSASDGTFVLPEWFSPSGERANLDRSSVIVFRRDHRVASVPLAQLLEQRELRTIPLSLFVGPPDERARELSEFLQGLVLIIISATEPRLPQIVVAVEAEQQTLPEEVRSGRMGRAEFEWMINDARRARQ